MQGGGFDFPPMPALAGHGGLSGLAAQPPRPGTDSSGPCAAGGSLEGHAVYVSYDEKREVAERKLGRKSGGHTYTVKFYLCDTRGTEYLAATGGQGPCLPCGGLQRVSTLAGAGWRLRSRLRSCCRRRIRPGAWCLHAICIVPHLVMPSPLQERTRGMLITCTRTPLASPSCGPTTRR